MGPEHHYQTEIIDCHHQKPTGDLAQTADMLVVLGGPQNPHTTIDKCPYFDTSAERATIRAFINQQRMVVGVCLGAQLIGEALGIPYEHSPHKEEGAVPVYLNAAGKQDPLLQGFQDGALLGEWHNDMPVVNDHTPVLATSTGRSRQIVRYGQLTYGLQCHMEMTPSAYQQLIQQMGADVQHHQQYHYVQSADEIANIDCEPMHRNLASFLDRLVVCYQ